MADWGFLFLFLGVVAAVGTLLVSATKKTFVGERDGFHVEVTCERRRPWSRDDLIWLVDVRKLRLGARTAIRLWSRGLSLTRAMQGGANVTTGAPDVDERFVVWATDPDVARAVLLEPDVREALEELEQVAALEEGALHPVGNLELRLTTRERVVGMQVVNAVLALARALELAADTPSLAKAPDRHGVGGASGLPVGVPASR